MQWVMPWKLNTWGLQLPYFVSLGDFRRFFVASLFSGGVKKLGRLGSGRVREGGLGRVGSGRLCIAYCTVIFGLRFVLRFILQHLKWRSICFDLHPNLPSEWKRRRKSVFPTRDHQRRNHLRCTTTKRMWSWSSLILKTVGNWIRRPVYRYWADLTNNS